MAPNYKSVPKEDFKPPYINVGSLTPVGIKVAEVCLIYIPFDWFEPRP